MLIDVVEDHLNQRGHRIYDLRSNMKVIYTPQNGKCDIFIRNKMVLSDYAINR